MPFFRIGSRDIEIQVQGAGLTYTRIGAVYTTYSGIERSQVRGQKRIWQGSTPPMLWSEADAVVAEIGVGITTVGGAWPGADNIDAIVELVSDTPIKDDREIDAGSMTGAQRVLTLRATEARIPGT
jgi:hypothetical protein